MDPLHDKNKPPSFWNSRSAIAFIVIGLVALFFLWEEHRAHLLGALPYLLFLLCPLMHLFMHHGHGHDHSHEDGKSTKPERNDHE